jgi:hypothetical protein
MVPPSLPLIIPRQARIDAVDFPLTPVLGVHPREPRIPAPVAATQFVFRAGALITATAVKVGRIVHEDSTVRTHQIKKMIFAHAFLRS